MQMIKSLSSFSLKGFVGYSPSVIAARRNDEATLGKQSGFAERPCLSMIAALSLARTGWQIAFTAPAFSPLQ
jgi:hypothetical protein